MHVTGVETFPIAVPAPHPGGPYWMVLRLDTDAGISGYGEMMLLSTGFRWPVLTAMIEDLVDQALIGHDPYNAEKLFDSIYGRAGYSHVPELTKVAILSAFDMACWDIVGKDAGQPVHRLLGGRVRDRVRTYTYLYAGTGRARRCPEPSRALARSRVRGAARTALRGPRLHRRQARSVRSEHQRGPGARPDRADPVHPDRSVHRGGGDRGDPVRGRRQRRHPHRHPWSDDPVRRRSASPSASSGMTRCGSRSPSRPRT